MASKGQRIGYVRVKRLRSERRSASARTHGDLDRIFTEKASSQGAIVTIASVTELCREGDTIVKFWHGPSYTCLDDLAILPKSQTKRGICVRFIKKTSLWR